jgi:hypothetical protein
MEVLRATLIITLVVLEDIVFEWRTARPIRTTIHVLRICRNTLWYAAREKIVVQLRRK